MQIYFISLKKVSFKTVITFSLASKNPQTLLNEISQKWTLIRYKLNTLHTHYSEHRTIAHLGHHHYVPHQWILHSLAHSTPNAVAKPYTIAILRWWSRFFAGAIHVGEPQRNGRVPYIRRVFVGSARFLVDSHKSRCRRKTASLV